MDGPSGDSKLEHKKKSSEMNTFETRANPRISIVTPSLNLAEFIEYAILSVLIQEYPNFEHIIIDGGSTDSTLSILKKYPHLNYVSERDKCQADALNKGFRRASGDIVGWLNADERYLTPCFHKISEYFRMHPTVDVAYGNCRYIDENGRVFKIVKALEFDLFLTKYLPFMDIFTCTCFFRRRIFEENNYLKLDYDYIMDREFFIRLAQKGYVFRHLNEFFGDFRYTGYNKTSHDRTTFWAETRKALSENDIVINRMKTPRGRERLRLILMRFARIKRIILKSLKGHYFLYGQRGYKFMQKLRGKARSVI
jgi:glycosyltransferase involved in cell wall biosynthesis